MTGAGGWLGGEIAAHLVERGAAVTALVRRRAAVLGNDGRPAAVARVLTGDVALPQFGWDNASWREAAGSHDLVVHCAALTQFGADEALARAVNVGGTAEVMALATAGGMGLVHVSTAYVNGSRAGAVLETDHPSAPFTNAYEASKAEAEALVRAGPVPFAIARPGIVVGIGRRAGCGSSAPSTSCSRRSRKAG